MKVRAASNARARESRDRDESVEAEVYPMQLERHQLQLRYERLRRRDRRRERRVLASLAEHGQQQPIVVVRQEQGWVVIDGYKRIRGLHRLALDTVWALEWKMEESAALMLEHLMRAGDGGDALQQGWLLQELSERFELNAIQLGQRFDKSRSWVCRRLGLVQSLPADVQDAVRKGAIIPHAAMKYLVPLARANAQAAAALARAIAPLRLSSRQVGVLYAGFRQGTLKSQELIVGNPRAYLRAYEQAASKEKSETTAGKRLAQDFETIGTVAMRARRRLEQGLWLQLMAVDRQAVMQAVTRARAEFDALLVRMDKEDIDARPGETGSNPAIA